MMMEYNHAQVGIWMIHVATLPICTKIRHIRNMRVRHLIRETKRGMVAVTYTGSHCPFLCTWNKWLPFVTDPINGMWMLNSLADEVAIEYYKAALDVYG